MPSSLQSVCCAVRLQFGARFRLGITKRSKSLCSGVSRRSGAGRRHGQKWRSHSALTVSLSAFTIILLTRKERACTRRTAAWTTEILLEWLRTQGCAIVFVIIISLPPQPDGFYERPRAIELSLPLGRSSISDPPLGNIYSVTDNCMLHTASHCCQYFVWGHPSLHSAGNLDPFAGFHDNRNWSGVSLFWNSWCTRLVL